MRGNFFFVNDYGVLIITADNRTEAKKGIAELVKEPDDWPLDKVERLDGRTEYYF